MILIMILIIFFFFSFFAFFSIQARDPGEKNPKIFFNFD